MGRPAAKYEDFSGVGCERYDRSGSCLVPQWEDETIAKYMNEDKMKLVTASPEEERKLVKAFRTDNLDDIAKKSPKYGQKIQDLLKNY